MNNLFARRGLAQRGFVLLISLLLTILAVSCKKETDIVDPTPVETPDTPPTPATGAVTPVGTPEGAAITAIIGPAGGTIQSVDKRIQIQIPAGALAANQTISMQPLTNNHCPAGTGQAFRLTPHGLTFAKPATITFQYDAHDVNGSAPEALRVAYQTDNGAWKSPAVTSLDTVTRTVTTQTTHFSDWGLFQTMHISPNQAFLNPGETVHLNVYQAFTEAVEIPNGELFVPLPTLIPAKYIERWAFLGDGTLIHRQNTGDYYAPNHIPTDNPEVVSVFLNKSVTIDGKVFKDIRLVANLFVAPEGVSIQVNGGGWQTYPAAANINSTQNVILTTFGEEYVSLGWVGKPTGVYGWVRGTDVYFNYVKGKLLYQHIYGKGIVSGGSLRVNGDDSNWVSGTFKVTTSGWINTGSIPATVGTASVKGVFRVKRL